LRTSRGRNGEDDRVTSSPCTAPASGQAGREAAGRDGDRRYLPVLIAIGALAAVLYSWNLDSAGYPPFYSMAVQSMAVSWKALAFGALDPRATVTIDKLAGSFVPQALAVRLFGFHAWSLALPQVVEGVAAVLVFHRVVRRWTGSARAGLLGCTMLALTPVVASMFEHAMEDGALIFCLVMAADRYQYAVIHGRLGSLVLAGVWVGVGFQAKMLEAWLILPAMAVGYLVCAPLPRSRRAAHLTVAGLATLAVSLSWILLYTFTPAADRPYIDGTTNNNAFSMVFGYNGLSRLGVHVPGALSGESAANLQKAMEQLGVPPGAVRGFTSLGTDGWGKLFGTGLGPEVGWLYPLAALALAAGLWWTRRAARTDVLRGGFVFWGLWFATGIVVFSAMSIPHTAYLSLLAPPVCALSAAGLAMYWRTWLVPLAVAGETVWTVYLARTYSGFLPWLTPAVIALAGAALLLPASLFLVERSGKSPEAVRRPWRLWTPRAVAVLGTSAMLATPFAWALSTFDVAYAGSALDSTAGPVRIGLLAGGSSPLARQARQLSTYLVTRESDMDAAQNALLSYVERSHPPGTRYAFATDDWLLAQPYVDGSGAPVLPMGGFSGLVPTPSLPTVQREVRSGQLRYFLLHAPGSFDIGFLFGSVGGGPTVQAVDSWVRSACAPVPSTAYGEPPLTGAPILYRCPGG
jgi:4-amino-4-deoxy-L-arabinose transferase-like glycosyltransferase